MLLADSSLHTRFRKARLMRCLCIRFHTLVKRGERWRFTCFFYHFAPGLDAKPKKSGALWRGCCRCGHYRLFSYLSQAIWVSPVGEWGQSPAVGLRYCKPLFGCWVMRCCRNRRRCVGLFDRQQRPARRALPFQSVHI